MRLIVRFVVVLFIVSIVAGVGLLATSDIPAPSAPVEKVIPNDRFPK